MRIGRSIAERNRFTRHTDLSELIPARDYIGLNEQDEELRLWVPEPIKLGLERARERASLSLTAYLTEFFTEYLFGRYELLRMKETKTGLYAPEPSFDPAKGLSCHGDGSAEPEPNLGKNIFPIKIFLPATLKIALTKQAVTSGLTLGEFARGIIGAHLFGQTYAPRHKKLPNCFVVMANNWEEEPPSGDVLYSP